MNDRDAARRERNSRVVSEVLARLEAMDFAGLMALFAEDAMLDMPYRTGGQPTRLEGKAAIDAFLRRFPQIFRRLTFVEHTTYPMLDPDLVAAEYRSEGEAATGRPYHNVYAAIFRLRDGQVILWREYFNPLVILEALRPAED